MANRGHLKRIKQGAIPWNSWRGGNRNVRADLSKAELSGANLYRANLSGADFRAANLNRADLREANLSEADFRAARLSRADLRRAHFSRADFSRAILSDATLSTTDLSEVTLSGANLSGANLSGANLSGANLRGAILNEANLSRAILNEADLSRATLKGATLDGANLYKANLYRADLTETILREAILREATLHEAILREANFYRANLSGADLSRAILVGTNLANTTIKDCSIYGISAWDVQLDGAEQLNLTITPADQPTITVDNLKIAQFIYLLLNNEEIRDVIDTIARKVVLILGCFSQERKAVLDALRDELRKQNYSPVLFDFEKPSSRNFTETVRTLAHLSRFIIADLTSPSSIPQELYAIIPTLAIPVQPLLKSSNREYSMFIDLSSTYHWVLPIHRYSDLKGLLSSIKENVIEPAEKKAQELKKR